MARLVKRFVEHCEKAPAAQNNETLQNTPLPAGKGSDFRLPQLPEYRKPDRQVIPLQTEVPQNRLHSQPPGGKPLLRKITHLAASETIVPLPSMRIDRNPGRNAPQSIFIRQLFPLPLRPSNAVAPPVSTARYTLERITRSPNDNSTESISRICFSEGFIQYKGYEYQQHITRQQVYAATRTQQHTSSNPQIAVIVELIVITRYDPNIQIDRIDDHFPARHNGTTDGPYPVTSQANATLTAPQKNSIAER